MTDIVKRLHEKGWDMNSSPVAYSSIDDCTEAGLLMMDAARLITELRADIFERECPRPINTTDDNSVGWCVKNGHCGCGLNQLTGVEKGHGYDHADHEFIPARSVGLDRDWEVCAKCGNVKGGIPGTKCRGRVKVAMRDNSDHRGLEHTRQLEATLTAMTLWLESNQRDVFERGLWEAIAGAEIK